MADWLVVADAVAVGLFGTVLSTYFCDINWTKRKNIIYVVTILGMATAQFMAFGVFGAGTIKLWYPLLTHLPLALLLHFLSKNAVWSVISVLTAYLCCQLRRWIALLAAVLFSGGENMQLTAQLAVTLPLMYIIIRYAASSVRSMSRHILLIQLQFAAIPAIGYVYDYITRVYTDWLSRGLPVVVEFMPFVCAVAYPVFTIYSAGLLKKQHDLEHRHDMLNLQVRQAVLQIEDMKKSQQLAAQYRHDLRHHLQYILSCAESGDTERIKKYIMELNDNMAAWQATVYCENITVNFILSAFSARAAEKNIDMHISVKTSDFKGMSDTDVCVMLSNILENAHNACCGMVDKGNKATIVAEIYRFDEKLVLQVVNSCDEKLDFEGEIPQSQHRGHGIGVMSICAIAEKYNGIYSFSAHKGQFCLRIVI